MPGEGCPVVTLAERGAQYATRGSRADRHVPESALAAAWEQGSFPRQRLVDSMGRKVRVIYRGRHGAGPGPDFRDAIIALEDGPVFGDVELHVLASDFRRHGHDTDPAYLGVVLHVVVRDDADGQTRLADGRRVPVVALGPPGAGQVSAARGFREPCRDSVDRSGGAGVAETLDRLGAMRFRQKEARWGREIAAGLDPEQALWRGLLEALGYGGQREVLRRVAAAVTWREACTLAAGGPRPVEQALIGAAAGHSNLLLRAGLRPGNRAEARLSGAAQLAVRFRRAGGIGAALLGPLDEADGVEDVLRVLAVRGLIGRARALEVTANVVLPLAAALCGPPKAGDGAAMDRFETLFAGLPRPARYGAVRHLYDAVGDSVTVDMRRQQGMLYLLNLYCSQGGCGLCPLS